MNCDFQPIEQSDGRTRWRCRRARCGRQTGWITGDRTPIARCLDATGQSRGFGDTVARITKAVGIEPCGGCTERQTLLNRAFPYSSDLRPRWVTNAELVSRTLELAAMLPADVAAVAGVTRSGMGPASLLAMHLHLPLWEINSETGLRPCGHGWRLKGETQREGRLLIVDDTVASGASMKHLKRALPKLLDGWPAIVAAVFASPQARPMVDLFAAELALPHYLEWNLFNSVHSKSLAVDFDGVLCHDCPPDADDDGPAYERFLGNAPPLYLPRKFPLRLIATGRLAKWVPHTRAWLARHGVQCERLAMGPWQSIDERSGPAIVESKAAAYRASEATLFVESDPRQAAAIAELSGKRVICPGASEVHG